MYYLGLRKAILEPTLHYSVKSKSMYHIQAVYIAHLQMNLKTFLMRAIAIM